MNKENAISELKNMEECVDLIIDKHLEEKLFATKENAIEMKKTAIDLKESIINLRDIDLYYYSMEGDFEDVMHELKLNGTKLEEIVNQIPKNTVVFSEEIWLYFKKMAIDLKRIVVDKRGDLTWMERDYHLMSKMDELDEIIKEIERFWEYVKKRSNDI